MNINKKVVFRTIKYFIFILTIVLVNSSCIISNDNEVDLNLMNSSESNSSQVSNNNLIDINNIFEMYHKFLTGEVSVKSKHKDSSVCIFDLLQYDSEEQNKLNKYAFFDMNDDGIPELLLWSSRLCYIITYKNNQLIIWYETSHYSKILNSGNELILVENTAPDHVFYVYNIFDFDGNVKSYKSFQKYDTNKDGKYDKNDLYYFGDETVEKSDWDLLTKQYLEESDDEIKWIRTQGTQ